MFLEWLKKIFKFGQSAGPSDSSSQPSSPTPPSRNLNVSDDDDME